MLTWKNRTAAARESTPANGTIARKFMTNTTVGLIFTKCNAIPTGINTSNRFIQLEYKISLNSSIGVFRCDWAVST